MVEKLNQVNELIDSSKKVPNEIKPIVKAICKGYIRESNGKIPLDGIINVCNTTFNKIDEYDREFSGENKIFANTETGYDKECNIFHTVNYLNDTNYIKLIMILTHELGHVITESKPCSINEDGIYPWVKRTTGFFGKCRFDSITQKTSANSMFGFKMSDGFLESICTKIFLSNDFRTELKEAGYDLKDYIYKDERLFPSRVYDEYKACFELFDYMMDGALFDFSCQTFSTNEELITFINKHKLNIIFGFLDKSNDALWELKKFEDCDRTIEFDTLLNDYLEKKSTVLNLAPVVLEMYNKQEEDLMYQQLLNTYKNTLQMQKTLPISEEEKKRKSH
ncbi:MAG: hypothetical protein MR598_06795 [Erysipelotrichaceae bacterium]|nr:hypothetical protein [Erysipelotrichaceae bacterium]